MNEFPEQIGPYSVDCEIGRGGMGVVYKETDGRLDRSVAIKAIPAGFTDNPDHMARFEREAKTLAALNHPNVGGIHGIEEHEGQKYLVLEYVDDETLADRLSRGPLRIRESLEVCAQIAEGLAAAHDAGFIHRDLKPANIKITSGGMAKVLDFGLAKVELPAESPPPSSETPTTGLPDTTTSPGTSPFNCESSAECIAALFSQDPDFATLPEATPAEAVSLLRRCLRKDSRRRHRDARDLRLILEDALDTLSADNQASTRASAITDRRFRISDELCRSLDREGFDALLPGWEMRFADNNRDSDVLVVWIPSIGGDHTTAAWRELMDASPYRMITVCPVGMEPAVANRPVVSIENQYALIRALTADLRARLNPRKTVVSGFSCGSIMALRCAAGDENGELFDGVLAIDADMQESDCFITRLFAGLDASSSTEVMNGLRAISRSCTTMHEWLVLHQHMIECVDKVKDDFSPLIRQGEDLSAPFRNVCTGDKSPFVKYLSDAIESVGAVRCVFHDSAENRRMLGEIRMMHMDTRCLGQKFTDDSFAFIPEADHTGMMSTERLLEYLDLIVEAL
jgi:hypothetical protein